MAGVRSRDWVWSTAGLAPDCAVRAWRDRITSYIVEMDAESDAADFSASFHYYELSALTLNRLVASPQRVVRTEGFIARRGSSDFDLLHVRSGEMTIRHCGQTIHAPAGSIVLLDNERPDRVDMTATDVTALYIPEHWLSRWVPDPKDLAARVTRADCGWALPLTAMLTVIAEQGLGEAHLPRSTIADQIGGQMALAFGMPPCAVPRHRQVLVEQIRSCIHERHEEPDISPGHVATQIGISKRYLHALLASSGTTFGRTLIEARLAHAERLLRDPRFMSYSLGTLAWHCGFTHQSHFTRLFKARYGRPPQAFRKAQENVDL